MIRATRIRQRLSLHQNLWLTGWQNVLLRKQLLRVLLSQWILVFLCSSAWDLSWRTNVWQFRFFESENYYGHYGFQNGGEGDAPIYNRFDVSFLVLLPSWTLTGLGPRCGQELSKLWCDTACTLRQDCQLHHIPSIFQAHHWQIHVSESSVPFTDSQQHVEFSHLFHWSFRHTSSKCMWAINSLTWWRSWHSAKHRTCWKFPFRSSSRADKSTIESNHLLKASQSISKHFLIQRVLYPKTGSEHQLLQGLSAVRCLNVRFSPQQVAARSVASTTRSTIKQNQSYLMRQSESWSIRKYPEVSWSPVNVHDHIYIYSWMIFSMIAAFVTCDFTTIASGLMILSIKSIIRKTWGHFVF